MNVVLMRLTKQTRKVEGSNGIYRDEKEQDLTSMNQFNFVGPFDLNFCKSFGPDLKKKRKSNKLIGILIYDNDILHQSDS